MGPRSSNAPFRSEDPTRENPKHCIMSSSKKTPSELLHLPVLGAFAVAQPIYDLLARNPEFLVAHGAGPFLIGSLVLFLSLGLPIFLVLIDLAVSSCAEVVRRGVHASLMTLLASLTLLPPAKDFVPGGDAAILTAALFGALLVAPMYLAWRPVRTFLTLLIPSILVFPLWFLTLTPAGRLLLPDSAGLPSASKISSPIPIVLIVLDEFGTTALLDELGRVDSVRFPNFATLAAHSVWFPNAVARHIYTPPALTAILTGRQPDPDAALSPTSRDYPKNLFTLLGSQYSVNASEAQTAFCPERVCRSEPGSIFPRNSNIFFADVSILYLHRIAPPGMARRLPTLDGRWTDFGQVHWERQVKDPSSSSGLQGRTEQFESFISGINGDEALQLNFLHVLLPHIPYQYLASGQLYNRSINHIFPEGISAEASGWTNNEGLIQVAYLQYLQQVGHVDRLLGKLLAKLAEEGVYDDSLIILTADHGVAFRYGEPRRKITSTNYHDVLKVPMFLKLPGQRHAEVNERLVSGIDILPTISHVLDINVPWTMDGHSMFLETASFRDSIDAGGFATPTYAELQGFPGLDWQLLHFGSRTPLRDLGSRGPFPGLVGRELSEFTVARSGELRFNSDVIHHFAHVDPGEGFLPALFRGDVVGSDSSSLLLAISLNGSIQATASTARWMNMDHYFVALLPSSSFETDRHHVEVFLIEQPREDFLLTQIRSTYEEFGGYVIRREAGRPTVLLRPDGLQIPVDSRPGAAHGNVEHFGRIEDMTFIQGWAGDTTHRPARTVVVELDGRVLAETRPSLARRDVADHFRRESMLYSGFEISIPTRIITGDLSDLKVFAVSQDGQALELRLPEAVP